MTDLVLELSFCIYFNVYLYFWTCCLVECCKPRPKNSWVFFNIMSNVWMTLKSNSNARHGYGSIQLRRRNHQKSISPPLVQIVLLRQQQETHKTKWFGRCGPQTITFFSSWLFVRVLITFDSLWWHLHPVHVAQVVQFPPCCKPFVPFVIHL